MPSDPSAGILRINDASLPYGADFPPHDSHRLGKSIDLRYFGVDRDNYDRGGKSADILAYVKYKDCVGAKAEGSSEELACASTYDIANVKERFANYVIANRKALFSISSVAGGVKILISSGQQEIPGEKGEYNSSKYSVTWHSDALVKGVWPDGSGIVDPVSGEALGGCNNDTFKSTGLCNLKIVEPAPKGEHLNHMHMYFETKVK